MKPSIRTLDGIMIVGVAGDVDGKSAGHLYDVLVGCTGEGKTKLIVDLSSVHSMTRAGVRGLIVAAKLMQQARGEMRICGARRQIANFLQGLGFDHLLKLDATLQSSMARLCGGEYRIATAPGAVLPFGSPAAAPKPDRFAVGTEDAEDNAFGWRRGA